MRDSGMRQRRESSVGTTVRSIPRRVAGVGEHQREGRWRGGGVEGETRVKEREGRRRTARARGASGQLLVLERLRGCVRSALRDRPAARQHASREGFELPCGGSTKREALEAHP